MQAANGPYRRFVPDASTAKFAGSLLRHPRRTGARVADLAREWGHIGAGRSEVAPSRRDRRFTDPAWNQNPLLRRVVQGYLATGQTARTLVADADADADLNWRDGQRVGFLVDNVIEALAPSNIPLVNPCRRRRRSTPPG